MEARTRLIYFVARLVPNVFGLATTAVLTRLLEPTEYGVYALGLSITFFLTIGVFEWLGLSVLRMAPAADDPDLLIGTILTSFYSLCAVSALAAILVLLLAGDKINAPLTIACIMATFASAWFELKQRLQLAELRAADYLWMNSARGLATMGLVCAAAYMSGSPPLIVIAVALGFFLASLSVRDRRLGVLRCRLDLAMCGTLFRFGFPLSISVGLATILMSIDKWLLQALSGPQTVGFFTAATFVAQMPLSALAAGIGTSAYSMAVHAVEFRSPEAARGQLARNIVLLLGIIVPGAAGIVALSQNLAHLMVGRAYWQSVIVLAPWLSVATIFSSVRAFYVDTAFQLAHHNSPLIWTMSITVAVNVVLDVLLIPNLGELGAAIGSCCALFLGLVVAAVASRGVFRLPIPFGDAIKIVTSSAAMFVVISHLAEYTGAVALALQIGVGALVYVGGIIAFNVQGVRGWAIPRFTRWLRAAAGGRR